MPATAPLLDALARCETELQRLAAKALAEGDYTTARTGLELAQGIAQQRNHADQALDTRPVSSQSASLTGAKPATKPQKNKLKTPRPRTTAKAYPNFVRDDDKLIKIGWSKRTRKEYQHKAPHSAVDAFVAHLRQHTRSNRIFKIDDLLPVPDPANDGDLPAYQVYLVLAWLRSLGSVSKHGRDGYSVQSTAISKKTLSQAWEQLSKISN